MPIIYFTALFPKGNFIAVVWYFRCYFRQPRVPGNGHAISNNAITFQYTHTFPSWWEPVRRGIITWLPLNPHRKHAVEYGVVLNHRHDQFRQITPVKTPTETMPLMMEHRAGCRGNHWSGLHFATLPVSFSTEASQYRTESDENRPPPDNNIHSLNECRFPIS